MKFFLCFLLFAFVLENTCSTSTPNWYHDQSIRLKRQFYPFRPNFNPNFNNNDNNNNNEDDDDDIFVFDMPQGFRPSRPRQFRPPLASGLTTTTTTEPSAFPNAGPPRLPPCEESCNTRTTPQYNPVCGDNGNTYFNEARLQCAQSCGNRVNLLHLGRCGPILPSLQRL